MRKWMLLRLSIPTVAAINGHALVGGLELALGCEAQLTVEHAPLAGASAINLVDPKIQRGFTSFQDWTIFLLIRIGCPAMSAIGIRNKAMR